jgi:hypothetical protein
VVDTVTDSEPPEDELERELELELELEPELELVLLVVLDEPEEPDDELLEPLDEDDPAELEDPVAPAFTEQTGQAPQPCPASTFSATAIWVDLLASAGLPEPP